MTKPYGVYKITKRERGEVAERFKAAVLKTVDVRASVGSNPTFSVFFFGEMAERPKALPC